MLGERHGAQHKQTRKEKKRKPHGNARKRNGGQIQRVDRVCRVYRRRRNKRRIKTKMKRHSDKKLISTGIFEELKKRVFITNNKRHIFSGWYYDKGRLIFMFAREEEKDAYNPTCCGVSLYYQHLNDYKDTFTRILNTFEKVEQI